MRIEAGKGQGLEQLGILTCSQLSEEDSRAAAWGKEFCHHGCNPDRSGLSSAAGRCTPCPAGTSRSSSYYP